MHDIAIGVVRIFTAGHDDKESVMRIDDFDIVDSELVVQCYGNDGFHRSVVKQFSYFYISDLHLLKPPLIMYFGLLPLRLQYRISM